MRDLKWTDQAVVALASLRAPDRRTLLDRLDLARRFPEMYPMRQRGRFASLRYFVVSRRWLVYYRAAGGSLLLVFAVVPALARRR